MKIYIAHSRSFDFINELYLPLKNSELSKKYELVFPHNENNEPFNSKEFFQKDCDLIIAEVSYPATGLGIELGWGDFLNIPIICIYKKNEKISGSLKIVSKSFLEYENQKDLVEKLDEEVKSYL